MSLREQILGAADLPKERVAVAEWGGAEFYIRTMTGAERERYEAGLFAGDGELDRGRLRARLVAFTAVDEAGARIFGDEDVAVLAGKSAAVLMRLVAVAQRLNGLTADAEEAAAKK